MSGQTKTFKGGYRFRNLKGDLENGSIEELPLPQKVIIPLQQGFCDVLIPLVKEGDKVQAGQIIARDDESLSSPLHATIGGTVDSFLMKGKGRRQKPRAVVITSDGSNGCQPVDGVLSSWEGATPDEIGTVLYNAGVSALGEAGIPTRYHSSCIEPAAVECILVGAVDATPMGLPTKSVIGDGKEFVNGLAIIRRALSDVPVHVAVASDNTELRDTIETAAHGNGWLTVHLVKKKYPADDGVVLAATILGKVAWHHQRAIDLGAVVIDPQTAMHAYEALAAGKPVIERLVALGGSGFSKRSVARVRIGSPYATLADGRIAEGVEPRLVAGGILAGSLVADVADPIDRHTTQVTALVENRKREMFAFMRPGLNRDSHSNAFLSALLPGGRVAVDTNVHGEHRPCVSCCYCDEVCPVDLYPHRLNNFVTHDMLEDAMEEQLLSCIDCGLCSYVCPSKIPLMKNMIAGKAQIVKQGWHEEIEA